MFIKGQWEKGSAGFEVYNPATGEMIDCVLEAIREHAVQKGAIAPVFLINRYRDRYRNRRF